MFLAILGAMFLVVLAVSGCHLYKTCRWTIDTRDLDDDGGDLTFLLMSAGAFGIQAAVVAIGWGILLGARTVSWFDGHFWWLAGLTAIISVGVVLAIQLSGMLTMKDKWTVQATGLAVLVTVVGGLLSYLVVAVGLLVCAFMACLLVSSWWSDYQYDRRQVEGHG